MAEVNWAGLKPYYCDGILPLREIAKQFGITHAAIRKHAEKQGWSRDLNKRIQAKAEELLNRQVPNLGTEVPKEGIQDGELDAEVVDLNAQRIVQIRSAHRQEITALRTQVAALSLELEENQDLKLTGKSMVLKTLSDTMRTLVAMEREAYGIDKSTPETEDTKPTDVVDITRRVAFMLAQATTVQ